MTTTGMHIFIWLINTKAQVESTMVIPLYCIPMSGTTTVVICPATIQLIDMRSHTVRAMVILPHKEKLISVKKKNANHRSRIAPDIMVSNIPEDNKSSTTNKFTDVSTVTLGYLGVRENLEVVGVYNVVHKERMMERTFMVKWTRGNDIGINNDGHLTQQSVDGRLATLCTS